jgi:muconate cycloisomerase
MQEDIINSPEFSPDALTEFPSIPKYIIKLHTDSGILGIGETHRGVEDSSMRRNADFVQGKNVFDLDLPRLNLPDRGGYVGFQMALYDAMGKALGWPLYRLLGGLEQRNVLVNYWCGRKNPVDARRVAERAVAGKFKGVKIKGHPGDPVVKVVEAIASVSPALQVTVDFNDQIANAKVFLPIGKALDAVGNMLVLEDPIPKEDLAGYQELRRHLKTPLAHHQNDPRKMMAAVRAEACTIFNTGPNPSMATFQANAYLADAAGMPVWHGSGHELGVMDAAMAHSCAATKNCKFPSDLLSYQRADDLVTNPFERKDSHVMVPDRPGLGVDLDEDAVQRYQVNTNPLNKSAK